MISSNISIFHTAFSLAQWGIWFFIIFLCLGICVYDIRERRIPHRLLLILLWLILMIRFFIEKSVGPSLFSDFCWGVGVLVVWGFLWNRWNIGAWDVKLLAILCLFPLGTYGPILLLSNLLVMSLIFLVGYVGGAYIAQRNISYIIERWVPTGSLPYGVMIVGAFFVTWMGGDIVGI